MGSRIKCRGYISCCRPIAREGGRLAGNTVPVGSAAGSPGRERVYPVVTQEARPVARAAA
jgi:hypothetical protein